MATVISSDKLEKHSINKYNFQVFSMAANEEDIFVQTQNEPQDTPNISMQKDDIEPDVTNSNSKESLIESLMQKTDEMSSNFIKLQMKLESMTEEHKAELLKVKAESFSDGEESGKQKMLKIQEENISNEFAQLGNSILTLEDNASKYVVALENIKDELISAALEISKEVVAVELSENSSSIAEKLSIELIEDLQGASKIILRVNPKNYGEITEKIGALDKIEIVSDSAISEGGVVAMSDVGNIDAQIFKRFQKVKKAALSE